MKKRFVLIVIDSLGIGAMADSYLYHPGDMDANTTFSLLRECASIKIPRLLDLGIMNTLEMNYKNFKASQLANFGKSNLEHKGADSFLGHQEIMGSKPHESINGPFSEVIYIVEKQLIDCGHTVERYKVNKLELLVVDNCATVGDNLETDGGRVYNVTGCFDIINFKDLIKIAEIVRNCVKVDRVIVFGGTNVDISGLLSAIRVVDDKYIGVDAPESGVYNQGYQVKHMGYGVDSSKQIQTILFNHNIPVYLFGKFADVIDLDSNSKYPGVESEYLLDKFYEILVKNQYGLFCLNIQETDLAGHAQDVNRYVDRVELVDSRLNKIISILSKDDILVVTADHGNDPTINHSNHTREMVPILIYWEGVNGVNIGTRQSMSDTAASISEFFEVEQPENGKSYLNILKNQKDKIYYVR